MSEMVSTYSWRPGVGIVEPDHEHLEERYQVVMLPCHADSSSRLLNRMAGEGWRFVAVVREGMLLMEKGT